VTSPLASAAGDRVEVWLIRTDLPDPVTEALHGLLDSSERERAATARFPASRRRYIAAHGTVRVILGRHLGVSPQSLRFGRGPHGKPELAGPGPGPQVSLSHDGDLAALAVSPRRRVGVDIQRLLADVNVIRMAERFYPPSEARFVAAAAGATGQAARFTRLWTRKEACLKVAGGRLFPGLQQAIPAAGVVDDGSPPCLVHDLPAPRGYLAAVAVEGTHHCNVIRRWARL
jgi:4'-phosphopantetheinyl transferase